MLLRQNSCLMEKTADLAHFYLKEGKAFIISNESGIYELKHKRNNSEMYTVQNCISYSLYYKNKLYYINNCNMSNLTKTKHAI